MQKQPSQASQQSQASGCAPRMADGRMFTDYRPRCDIALQYAAPMSGSHEYRQWLIRNGGHVMDSHRRNAAAASFCGPCLKEPGTMAAERDRFVCDKVACTRIDGPAHLMTPLAIGTGRQYSACGLTK